MNLSHDEAEQELAAIRQMTQKARHTFATSGATIFLIVTGAVWLVGFLATQFLSGTIVATIRVGASLLGTALSILFGSRLGPRVRGQAASETAKRAGLFWLFLALLVALEPGNEVDFTYLRELLDVMDGNLGAHLRKLEEAGYITITKAFVDRKPRTYVGVTTMGRDVFRAHVSTLEEILKKK